MKFLNNVNQPRLRILTAITLSVIMLASTIGCAGNGTTSSSASPSSASTAKEKVLRIGYVGFGDNGDLKPLDQKYPDLLLRRIVQEPLVDFQNGKLIPKLAESWEFQNEGKDLILKLKKGITFHDGTPFDAQAVKFSLERARAIKAEHPFSFDSQAVVEIPDSHAIVLKMSKPSYYTLVGLAEYHMAIVPPTAVEPAGDPKGELKKLIGTGPFQFIDYKKGQSTTLQPYANYWGTKPKFDKLVVRAIPDANARVTALKAGDIDLVLDNIHGGNGYVPRSLLSQLENMGYGIVGVDIASTRAFIFNWTKEPFNDPRVRQALAYAVNQDSLTKNLFGKWIVPANQGLFAPSFPFIPRQSQNWYPYDLEKAKSLLKEAGWNQDQDGIWVKKGHPLSIEMIVNSTELDDKQVAEIVQDQLRKFGAKVNLTAMDSGAFGKARDTKAFDLAYYYAGGPECRIFMRYNWMFMTKGNFPAIFADPAMDPMVQKALTTFDDQERVASFLQAGDYINRNAGIIPIYYDKVYAISGRHIRGFAFEGSNPDFSRVEFVQ